MEKTLLDLNNVYSDGSQEYIRNRYCHEFDNLGYIYASPIMLRRQHNVDIIRMKITELAFILL